MYKRTKLNTDPFKHKNLITEQKHTVLNSYIRKVITFCMTMSEDFCVDRGMS